MNSVSFLAESASDALEQIHAKLGPEAVVVSVRKRPAQGLARLWPGSSVIEVLATVPQPAAGVAATGSVSGPVGGDDEEDDRGRSAASLGSRDFRKESVSGTPAAPSASDRRWRSVAMLESAGLLPLNAERLREKLDAIHGPSPPNSLADEFALTRAALTQFWRAASPQDSEASRRPHVFVGPPGSGKTTVLCKWLAHAVLFEGRAARVWRLDGAVANTAESLSVYGEILGVPVERFWEEDASRPSSSSLNRLPNASSAKDADGDEASATDGKELRFVDLPGVEAHDAAALAQLAERLRGFPTPHVHLVLNAAYEVPTLLAQIRAFAALPVNDLVITHLDEEPRVAKLWNLVIGTNYSVRFLSGGQNVPGDFLTATPEHLFPQEIR